MRRSKPSISVVIPCRNEEKFIGSLLEAIARQDTGDFEIVIADGLSTDRTLEIIRRFADTHAQLAVLVLVNSAKSIPAGLNLAIQHASGDVIVRLDAHSCPASNYLSRCQAVLLASGAELVGGAWVIKPGNFGKMAQAIALAVSSPFGAGDAPYRLKFIGRARDVDTVPFGCFRRETWKAVGGFDESLLANEDYEFNLRIRRSGGRVHFDPRIRCDYFARPSFLALAKQYWRYGWWKAQVLKMHPASLKLRQAIPPLFVAIPVLLILLTPVWPGAAIAAAAIWSTYLVTATCCGLLITVQKGWNLFVPILMAFMTVHLAWGAGFWCGLFQRKSA